MMLAPIVLFVYKRPEHTKWTIDALKANDLAAESHLFIFSDAAKDKKSENDVKAVREYIDTIDGFKQVEIIKSSQNKGLANSIISGVSQVISDYGSAIVLEDDLVTAKNFLRYMNSALSFYRDHPEIWSISAYNPPIAIPGDYRKDIYFSYRGSSWGWGTWRDRWEKNDWNVSDYQSFLKDRKTQQAFNRGGYDLSEMLRDQMDGQMDSWAIRWCYSQFKDGSYTVYPITSKVQNIGYDGSGTHCEASDRRNVDLDIEAGETQFLDDVVLDERILESFKEFYKLGALKHLKKITKDFGFYQLAKPIKDLIYSH